MPELLDYEFQPEKINTHQPALQKLNKVIDWELFRKPIKEALHVTLKIAGGRPPNGKLIQFLR